MFRNAELGFRSSVWLGDKVDVQVDCSGITDLLSGWVCNMLVGSNIGRAGVCE